jgi:hypothetical protein
MGIEDDIRKRREAKKKYEAEDEKERLAKGDLRDSNEKAMQEKLTELYDRAERLVEQVNALYTQYFSGIESRPPDTRREQLEQLINALQIMAKPTEVYRFRYQSVYGTYLVYRNKWDRGLKDLENGKIKRIVRKRMTSSS